MYKFLLILLIAFTTELKAQKSLTSPELSLYFDQPEVLRKAGVSNVRCIFKDSRSLIWIGTGNGLFRFDGTNTVYHRHKPGDTTSIPNNTVVSLSEDKNGQIWIGTLGGIARMNPYNFKCKVYRDELNSLPKGNFDNKILVDSSGNIWAGNSEGLFFYDKMKDRFEEVWKHVITGKPISAYITSLAEWNTDTLVLGTFNDIVVFNKKNHGFKRIPLLNKDVLTTQILVDGLHRLWIGTWGEGCIISNVSLTRFQQYKWEKDLRTGVDNIVTAILQSNQNIWISGGWVLTKFPLEQRVDSKKASTYKLSQNLRTKDPDNISCLVADKQNYIWAGGSEVSRFSSGKSLFQALPVAFAGSVQDIQALHIDHEERMVVSMWHGKQGLLIFDRQKNEHQFINSIAPGDVFGSNISGIATDKFKRIWLSSLAGVYVLDKDFRITKDLSTIPDIPSARKTNGIIIHRDTAWILCYKKGIDLYDLEFHKLKHFIDHDSSGLLDNLIEKLFQDRHGNIWVCGNSYFYKYLPGPGRFKKYDFSIEHSVYSPADVVETPDGDLAIASEAGLILFNPLTEKFHYLSTPLLQKEETVASVAVDRSGNIWYLTSAHLVKYEPSTGKFTLFGEEDGLNTAALQTIRTFDGKQFFLAETKRILQFTPANWEPTIDPPHVFIHSVQIRDSMLQFSSPLSALHLDYNQNKIYIEFDGVNYTKPEQNQYAYKLTGIDRDWIFTNQNFASYANLSPGNYAFRVKAANYAGVWSPEYVINISISPPYWKTWWFIALSVIVIGSLFVLVIRYISQRNLREKILRLEKEQAVERERNRIARDMHDDLGSGLTKIAILSEVAKTQLKEKEAATVQLESISHSSRELVDSLQNIIWVLNPKNDSLESLAAYIREYALKYFEATEISVQFAYPNSIPPIKLTEEQRRNIFLVVKETLNNIVKHSCCRNIFVDLSVGKQEIGIVIKDDGKGFDPLSIRRFGNGLNNMVQRIEQINGSYRIQSGHNKGTSTTLIIPV